MLNTIFFVGPFAQVDHFAAFTTKWPVTVCSIPDMFFSAMGTGNDRCLRSIDHMEISKILID
jgi:hypothetical protein